MHTYSERVAWAAAAKPTCGSSRENALLERVVVACAIMRANEAGDAVAPAGVATAAPAGAGSAGGGAVRCKRGCVEAGAAAAAA